MLSEDRDALLCDMAETYQIYDMRALPVKTLATLACGLREDSRIKLKMANLQYYPAFVSLMRIHDMLTDFLYGTESEAFRFRSVTEQKPEQTSFGYATGDEFMAARARYIKD